MIGKMAETLIRNFSVKIENSAPYRADWKGVVEQRFRILPARFKAYTPGYIQTDYMQRGGNDYRLDAMLDIDQFTKIVILCILYYNTEHRLKEYNLTPEQVHDKVSPVPLELWNWGIENRSGRLRRYPDDLVQLALLPYENATVTERGIRLYGLFYSCPLAIKEHWFERARQSRTWKVRASYDPRCMDTIWLHGESGQKRFIPCALMAQSSEHVNKTLWELDQMRQETKIVARGREKEEKTGRINLIDQIQSVVDEAKTQRPQASGMSARQRTKDIRGNRHEEKVALQRANAIRADRNPTEDPTVIVPFPRVVRKDYSVPDITEMLSKFRDGDQEGE